jgi:hypothetical protein
VNWMHLASLSEATAVPPRAIAADRYEYPQWQANHEVDQPAFDAVRELTDEATRLQGVFTQPSGLAGRIRAEAFSNVSYAARENDVRSQVATRGAIGWVQDNLHAISVSAPRRVILSSNSGSFSVTVTNGLDEPVSIRIRTSSRPPMTIRGPDSLELGAGSAATVLLEASTEKLGVHNVTIALTDASGTPLGSADVLPVRAAQVSQVIWLIMGVAVALLFIAIVLRVVRRIRGGGSSSDDDSDPEPGDDPSDRAERQPEPAASP